MALSAEVNVRDFGATGDGETDDTVAIRKAFAASKEIFFPGGVYVVSDGLRLPPSSIIRGDGSPTLGAFPLDDDKDLLDPISRKSLPGTTLLFRGSGSISTKLPRSDSFSEVRYAISTSPGRPYSIRDLAIVLDVNIRSDETGRRTRIEDDERADYDVGFLVDDSPGGSLRDVSIFGYWKKAGLCVVTRGEGSNPDYNTFWNCSFTGDYGVALIGFDTEEGPGLSGTQFYGCNLFSNDHHSRKGNDWGSGALFIDGKTGAKNADINGHYFFGGCIRTYHNVAVRLDHASNVNFQGVVFEVPAREEDSDGRTDTTGQVIGTDHTRDVSFLGCRMQNIGIENLAAVMKGGQVTEVGGGAKGIRILSGDRVVRLNSSAQGDPLIQLSTDGGSINTGWTMRMDVSEGGSLSIRHDNKPVATFSPEGALSLKNLSAGQLHLVGRLTRTIRETSISADSARIRLKGGVDKVLSRINGGKEGSILILEPTAAENPCTVQSSNAGNVHLPSPFVMDHRHDRIMLMKSGEDWVEISRTDFPAETSLP